MIGGLVGAVVFVIVMIIVFSKEVKQEQQSKPKARVSVSDGYRTVSSGKGNSVDEAFTQMFVKMYTASQNAVKSETIQRRIDEMQEAMHKCPPSVSLHTAKYCASLLDKARERKRSVEDEELRRRQEKQEALKASTLNEETLKLKAAQQKAEDAASKAKAEKAKYEKKAAALKNKQPKKTLKPEEMTPHQLFMYEQRRLMTDSLRYDVMQRDGFRCVLCGATTKEDGVKLHVDHITPISKGGRTELSNLRTLCERCNLGKRDKIETSVVEHGSNNPSNDTPSIVDISFDDLLMMLHKDNEVAAPNITTLDDLISYLDEKKIACIDKRAVGGCLWVASCPEADKLLPELQFDGNSFSKAARTSHFNGEPGWYIS